MSKESPTGSEVLKKGGVLVAVLSAVVNNSLGVFAGVLSYFTGSEMQLRRA